MLIMGTTLITIILISLVNLITDVIQAMIGPRVRLN